MNEIETYCRICMKEQDPSTLQNLQQNICDYFFSITQTKLIKIEQVSNLICIPCCTSLKQAYAYRSELIKIQDEILNRLSVKSTSQPPMEVDSNTVLLIKQEPELEISLDPYNLSMIEEDNLGSDSECVVKRRAKRKKKKNETHYETETIHCDHCDKPINKYYYKKHYERVHISSNSFICDVCNHQSQSRSSLEVHMTKHFGIKPFSCDEGCEMKFRTKKDLRLHLHSEHPESTSKCDLFICETCGKSFRFKKSMEIHVRSNHTLERPFRCDVANCNSAYFCKTNLMTHKKRSHSFEVVTCEVCGKTFNSLINLNEHVRKNHKEGRYVCPEEGCGRRFITPYYLNLHTKTHYGIRDRECEVCGSRFFNKKHLNQHVEVAHKKSRFFCQVPNCTSVFSRKCNIREHVKKIHRELTEELKQHLLSEITKMKPIYMVNDNLNSNNNSKQ